LASTHESFFVHILNFGFEESMKKIFGPAGCGSGCLACVFNFFSEKHSMAGMPRNVVVFVLRWLCAEDR